MADATTFGKGLNFLTNLFSDTLNNLMIAVLILLMGFVIGRVAGKLAQRILHQFDADKAAKKLRVNISIELIVGKVVEYIIYIVVVIMFLNQIGLTKTVLNLLASGIVVIIALSFFLAVRDFMPNFFAWIVLRRKKILKIGDSVIMRGIKGRIERATMTEVVVQTKNGDLVYIPNMDAVKNIFLVKKRRK